MKAESVLWQRVRLGLWLCGLLGMALAAAPLHALEKVRLQLKWHHQFQFAGYYAAQKQGYYREAGLEVEILDASPGLNTVQLLLDGKAEYGVGNSDLLLARATGKPVVALAVIMQHSPFVLLARQQSDIERVSDLAGRRVMIEPQGEELLAFLQHEGVDLQGSGRLIEQRYDLSAFIDGEIDAISAYSMDEPYELLRRGIPFNTFSPREAGIDFYGDNLFTTEQELADKPKRVERFRQASLRGWRYALQHPDEMVDYILAHYPVQKDRDFLLFEARQLQQLMLPELIDIGYMLPARWRHIAETYAGLGMLPQAVSLEGFLYEEPQPLDLFLVYIIIGIVLVVLPINMRFATLNARLRRLLFIQNRFANIGESFNNIAHQWKHPLNELALQLMRIRQLASRPILGEAEMAELHQLASKGHELLDYMGNTVDAFSHTMHTGKKVSEFSPCTVIEQLLNLVGDSFSQQGIVIHYYPEQEATVEGNSTELSHAVLSLLNNAREIFAERGVAGPEITLSESLDGNTYTLQVADNGGGIEARPPKRIFALGFSGKRSPDTGVGLYIARKIVVECFNGMIEAGNRAGGACFTITIPLRNVTAEAVPATAS